MKTIKDVIKLDNLRMDAFIIKFKNGNVSWKKTAYNLLRRTNTMNHRFISRYNVNVKRKEFLKEYKRFKKLDKAFSLTWYHELAVNLISKYQYLQQFKKWNKYYKRKYERLKHNVYKILYNHIKE